MRRLRREQGKQLQEMAKAIVKSSAYCCRIELNDAHVSPDRLCMMAGFLGVPVWRLVEDVEFEVTSPVIMARCQTISEALRRLEHVQRIPDIRDALEAFRAEQE